jgi:hypothetical protein
LVYITIFSRATRPVHPHLSNGCHRGCPQQPPDETVRSFLTVETRSTQSAFSRNPLRINQSALRQHTRVIGYPINLLEHPKKVEESQRPLRLHRPFLLVVKPQLLLELAVREERGRTEHHDWRTPRRGNRAIVPEFKDPSVYTSSSCFPLR